MRRAIVSTSLVLAVLSAGSAGCAPAARSQHEARASQAGCIADEIPADAVATDQIRDACRADVATCEARCSAGRARACLELAYALETGDGEQQAAAVRYYALACHLGELNACTNYGAAQRLGKGLRADLMCSARVFERTCSGGEPWGCGMFGQALLNGEGITQDPARALTILRAACDASPGFSCAVLAVAHERGRFAPKDHERAQTLFRRACAAGVPSACTAVEPMTPTMTL